jgi:hypothetical protein
MYYNGALQYISGFNNLDSIGGYLYIGYHDSLTSIQGLSNLKFINGSLSLYNNNELTTIEGFAQISSVGEYLWIGANRKLADLTAFSNLSSVDGNIYIEYNDLLGSLSGLDSIDPGSVQNLEILYNAILATCEVKSICDYLANPGGDIVIVGNATGCASEEEVESACIAAVPEDRSQESEVNIYPNPASGKVQFSFHISQSERVTIKIFDLHGREVATVLDSDLATGMHYISWDTELLAPGVYFHRISTINNRQSAMGKIIVVK